MDDDRRETARRLFAACAATIEKAHDQAARGQHPRLDAKQASLSSRNIVELADRIRTLAEAAGVVAGEKD
ncbi:hypothetical protein FHS78_003816 [Parvibaculum indicum]|uniref:hypothetical protein n=1 Tax=Parvibaculum indicum TaxID=562969 RepID=UPI0014214D1E|nr:hypothetical protein [Parvibaculum indicum]NIJ43501.1 hypothetical protein [Parvibaculum indicum]